MLCFLCKNKIKKPDIKVVKFAREYGQIAIRVRHYCRACYRAGKVTINPKTGE